MNETTEIKSKGGLSRFNFKEDREYKEESEKTIEISKIEEFLYTVMFKVENFFTKTLNI